MSKQDGHAARAGTGGLWLIGGLALALVGVGVMVVRGLMQGPGPAAVQGSGTPATSTGEDYDTALTAAEALVKDNRPEEAVRLLERVITVYPDRQGARLALAQTRRLMGQLEAALVQYQAAIKIGPASGALLFDAGCVADDAGKPEVALDLLNRAQFADPKEPRYPLWLAQVQIKAGQDDAAKTSLLRCINLNPDLAIAWGTLAQLELRGNQLDLATQHAQKARTLEPASLVWRVLMGRVLVRQNKPDEALDLLTGIAPPDRLRPGVLPLMAQCLGLRREPARAAKLYEEAAELAPKEPDWAFQAAVWHERAGDAARARVWAGRAATLGHADAAKMVERLSAAGGPG